MRPHPFPGAAPSCPTEMREEGQSRGKGGNDPTGSRPERAPPRGGLDPAVALRQRAGGRLHLSLARRGQAGRGAPARNCGLPAAPGVPAGAQDPTRDVLLRVPFFRVHPAF